MQLMEMVALEHLEVGGELYWIYILRRQVVGVNFPQINGTSIITSFGYETLPMTQKIDGRNNYDGITMSIFIFLEIAIKKMNEHFFHVQPEAIAQKNFLYPKRKVCIF